MRVGRNEPCPCGSGQKSKNCCGERLRKKGPGGLAFLFGSIAVVAAIGVIPPFIRSRTAPPPAVPAPAPLEARTLPAPQPAGDPPPGKVWSAEHGHWHDETPASPFVIDGLPVAGSSAAANSPISATVNVPPAPQPQPAGDPPPGKVWSAEHGHWHDAP